MSQPASYFKQTKPAPGRLVKGVRWLFLLSVGMFLAFSAPAQTQVLPATGTPPAALESLGDWIWDSKTSDWQVCLFWRAFELPATNPVTRAVVQMTVDNEFALYLDGQELGCGSEWEELYSRDITALLTTPGQHVVAVRTVNVAERAGMIFGLRIEFADGQSLELKSDSNWRLAPANVRDWFDHSEAAADWGQAMVVGRIGVAPRWSVPRRVVGFLPPGSLDAEMADPSNSPTHSLGKWIWAKETTNRQVCQFWRAFELPETNAVSRARLRLTADNEFVLYLDGRELGRGSEWREIYLFDVTALLASGRHVLMVKAANSFSLAGMIFGLWIEFENGEVLEVPSDTTWRIAPAEIKGVEKYHTAAEDWETPVVVGQIGIPPRWLVPQNVNVMPKLEPLVIRFWQRLWFQISVLILLGAITVFSLWLLAQLALQRKEQVLLERERARIAADIHDDIGARITQLVLHGEVTQSELENDSAVRPQLERICEEARQVLATMDEVLWAVNPERDTLRDFTAFVCCYAEEYLKPTEIQCRLEVDPEMPAAPLDLPLRRNLLMAIKETLNNTVKHSGATELSLQIHRLGQKLHVVVQDNGKGFDPAQADRDRQGLTNLTRRMKELGGSCRVVSQPGAGCRTEFIVPLQRSRGRLWRWLTRN